VIIQNHKKTPGIGSKIQNHAFLSQFDGYGQSLLEHSKDKAVLLEI
jgi:Na+-translocating ferredoxin:NAD+ oxidoreductase RnfG subunit